MAWIRIINIVLVLLLYFQLAQLVMHIDDGDGPEHLSARLSQHKKQRSWDFEEGQDQDQDQWQVDTYMESRSGICSAENAHEVRYEKNNRCKGPKKVVKDEDDDDEDSDPAANDDEDDDDDDEEDGDDENDEEGNEFSMEDEAFVERITCLLGSLHKHTKAMTDNLKILQSRLGSKKSTAPGTMCRKTNFGTMISGHPNAKWLKKPDFYGEQEPCGEEKCDSQEGMELEDSQPAQPLGDDHRIVVPPLLQLIHGAASLQSHLKGRPETSEPRPRYWMPTREAPEDLQAPLNSIPEDKTLLRYEEYEARLRSLMDNRDAIERNVMKMISPRR
ncbi:uncharacterized protein LOC108032946 [Drosophila biarmipes]|uniref:uncharacterized protein LOC108032946 n=1 Tax=Drosophila biarmipes TaxID=125945 RepID=UPI0007E698B7|nr:uncharacterized protein LOC108032946 [Drosophila biarmipes]